MKYSPRYRLFPNTQQREQLEWTVDVVRQVYNDALGKYKEVPRDAGTLRQRVRSIRDELPSMKSWWSELNDVYSTVLQNAVMRIRDNVKSLQELQKQGSGAGELKWKAPREFRSFTYNKKGFELDKKSGPSGRGTLTLKKIAGDNITVPIRLHRDFPEHDSIQQLTVKQDTTSAWHVSFTIKTDSPEKPAVDEIDVSDCVGIDLGITTFIHDSDGREIGRLDLSEDRERLERAQRSLSRKQHGSNNWSEQRRRLAEVHQRMSNKKRDFKHKLAHFYTTSYDAVFLEDLNVKSVLEGDGNARNTQEVGWRDLIRIFEHHGRKNGCHVITVEPAGTTKECASCGVSTEKPLWVREHSCPTCGFSTDRDLNAAANILHRGVEELGVVHSESTPAETATATSTDGSCLAAVVDASRVVEAGSRVLKEPASTRE
ncbi:IS1341-type transposase [Halorubrum coriense DSM 10284]|uniref:IS1341-type transposase n=1 Tax=Halorubrum coriense DSM 10284 TaxID=1227466 RepID=M0ELZ5_9EURY|nr:RNA-guided endonuclease TnpB family protein [Halorubrum coriense]ELZ48811.1 IS1341-type transposase [Halorubrum coriense DSM 10284]